MTFKPVTVDGTTYYPIPEVAAPTEDSCTGCAAQGPKRNTAASVVWENEYHRGETLCQKLGDCHNIIFKCGEDTYLQWAAERLK